ncbi:unnamed protein product [Prorocentrum cordatum]|uniref:Beta-galactosidase n=1 Tax=Prorocentrum cordatum TaxID=2364126 RepID=A0ABN9SXX7_9DINO|nr:unnamed protein product [Polarella glacialis]
MAVRESEIAPGRKGWTPRGARGPILSGPGSGGLRGGQQTDTDALPPHGWGPLLAPPCLPWNFVAGAGPGNDLGSIFLSPSGSKHAEVGMEHARAGLERAHSWPGARQEWARGQILPPREVFVDALSDERRGQVRVLCAYGHVHDQRCEGEDDRGVCDTIMTGGGGGCCPSDLQAGFTAVRLTEDDGGFEVDVESARVKLPPKSCRWKVDVQV